MADLSSMSDDDLKAAYAQSDVSSLSDDDLKAEYQKSLDTAPTPSVDEYGRPVAGSSPEMDQYIGNSSIGHVLDAVGHGLKQGWGADEIVHPDTADALKKAGVLPDVEKGQTGIIRGFNEALLRPAAAGLDLAIRAGGQVIRGIGAGIAGIQAGIAQTGEEAGAPQLGRDVAGMFEAFPAGPMHEMGIPHAAPLDLGVARTEGVLGTEKQWKGIEAPTEDFPAGTVTHYSVPTMTIRAGEDGAEGMKPYAPTLSPDMQPPTEAPAPANVHEAARQVAPDTFREYDDLAESRQQLSDTIAAQSEGLRQSAEMQAPHAAEIADLEARLQDTTPRLAKKYRERLDALSPERDAFLTDDFTMSALSRDTPELAAQRQQLQEIDYRMRDLAPDVSAAYREAGKQFPELVAEAPAQSPEAVQPAPQPEPQPVAEAAQPRPEAAQPTPVAAEPAPQPAAEQPTILGANPAAAEAPKINIASDVSQKLQAAGRPAEEAEAAGAVQDALWRTRAAAFDGKKGTAEEMYTREAPHIRAGRETKTPKSLELAQKGGRELEQQAASPQTKTPEFKKWFGESKVVDRKGAPLAVYHGSPDMRGLTADDARFSTALERFGQEDTHAAYFFTSDAKVARTYADPRRAFDYQGSEPGVLSAFVSLKNPAEIDWDGKEWMGTGAAIEAAREAGNDGIIIKNVRDRHSDNTKGKPSTVYVAFKPEQVKSATRNSGEFNPSDARIYYQTAQGKIRLTENGPAVITLFSRANASTFLHETGHDWLERMMRDAADPDAPAHMVADAKTVRDYLGNDGGELTTRQHEKFARSFERYFMEGRAPSAALAGVFEKFKNWLTTIYQTVARLKAPITDDIRDVFDRLLAGPSEAPTIARESPADAARELADHASPGKAATPYTTIPKEPKRLVNFLRESQTQGQGIHATTVPGGLRDPGGDVSAIIGGPKGRPGLINNKSGQHLDDATLRAWQEGYFPEHGDERPEINHLLDAIAEDHNGNARYSMHDQDAVDAYHHAMDHNAEITRLSSEHGIDTTGLTREQFFAKVADKVSTDEAATEIRSLEDTHDTSFSEIEADVRDMAEPPWQSDQFYGIGGPRTLEDLEHAYGQENAARSAGQGDADFAEHGYSDGPANEGQGIGGPGGRGAGAEGRAGAEAGQPGSGGSGDGGAAGAGGGQSVSGGGEPEPKLEPINVKTEPQDFRTKEDREIEKAANIRLDKINTPDDMSQALRDLAAQNGDFMDARYGAPAYQLQTDINNTRILLRAATSDMMEAAKKAAGGDPAAIADWVTKQQRAAMVFRKLSTYSADWAHAGHELNRVMDGWGDAKAIAQTIQDSTGKTLFQLQQEAAAMAAMPTAEKAGKFASDLLNSKWENGKNMLLSYFINNLISGPITHGAYGVGNTTMALYRAVPETTMQAVVGAVRGALSDAPVTDRVYFREVMPQLYGMFKGARDGIGPALRAFKSGVPELQGDVQAELGMSLNSRAQVIPGMVGKVLETPSRAVSAIHTFFYSMAYSQEIGRLAARDAAARGLTGSAFDAEVARLTASPSPEMMSAASDAGMHGTLMQRPAEGFQKDLVAMTNKYMALKLAVPFMQIGTNVLKEGILDRTSLSMLSSEARAEALGLRGGAARDVRMGKIAAGSMLGAATVGMAMEGMITGGGPSDPNKRRLLQSTGWQPYSMKVDGMYVPYRKFLGPLGPLVAAHADMFEIAHSMGNEALTQTAKALAFGFGEVVASETWMSGISNMIDALHDTDGKGASYLRGLATSFLPFSVGMAQVARMVDPYQRQAHSLLDAAKNKIPFLSETLEPQIGAWGQPIGSHMMVSPSTYQQDPVVDRMRALGLGMTPLERKITGIPLTDQQYGDYARTAGMLTHQRLSAMVQAPGFADLPAGVQTKAIQETIMKSRETAAAMMKMRNPSIIQQATQNKLNLRTIGRGGAY